MVCCAGLCAIDGNRPSESRAAIATVGEKEPERWYTYPPDSVERQRVVGRLMSELRPGMTRQEVESIIGPADDPRDILNEGERGTLFVSKYYYCLLPHLPKPGVGYLDLVIVDYEVSGPVQILTGLWRDKGCDVGCVPALGP